MCADVRASESGAALPALLDMESAWLIGCRGDPNPGMCALSGAKARVAQHAGRQRLVLARRLGIQETFGAA